MSLQRIVTTAAVLLALACAASATPQTSNDSSSIKRTLDLLARAGNAGEVRALEKLYSEDVVIVPTKGDPIIGRARALDESLRASREFKLNVELSTDATVINSET